MADFDADLRKLSDEGMPEGICHVEPGPFSCELTFIISGEMVSAQMILPDDFRQRYPSSNATLVYKDLYEDLPTGDVLKLLKAAYSIASHANSSSGMGDGPFSSDDFQQAPTGSMDDDDMLPTCGSGDAELPMDPELLRDIQAAREYLGHDAVTTQDFKTIDTLAVLMHLNIAFLDRRVAAAWGLSKITSTPLVVKLYVSRSGYRSVDKHKVDCIQDGAAECGLLRQLERILQTFVAARWRGEPLSEEPKPIRPYTSVEPVAAAPPPAPAKSSSWRRGSEKDKPRGTVRAGHRPTVGSRRSTGPAGAAAGAGGAAAKRVRGGEKPVTKAAPATKEGPRVDVAALTTMSQMGIDEERALLSLELCGGDLARAVAFATDPDNEGVLAQRLSSKPPEGDSAKPPGPTFSDQRKAVPTDGQGLLVQVAAYALRRIPTCPEFCVICDRPHRFSSGAMLKLSVCSRDMCSFAFQNLKVGADAAKEVSTDTGVVDLLVAMMRAAANSSRWSKILNPYPLVFDPDSEEKKVLDPTEKDISRVRRILKGFPTVRELNEADCALEAKARMDLAEPCAFPLLNWIISSNRSQLVKMRQNTIREMKTPHQYLLLSAAPEKQARFDQLKREHGTVFAFHGSCIENWHSILRNGLYNASGTDLQLHGAAHGPGIYLSPDSRVSFGYSSMAAGGDDAKKHDAPHREYISSDEITCIAICEVVDKGINRSSDIWVQPDADSVVTRFLFVYDAHNKPASKALCTTDQEFKETLRRAVKQHTEQD
eukprot:Hpha_TRINITY_DN19128_c0_g1::TRINITY_DN19128_c0_g1_i1::g.94875::m.94875/K15258/PARP6_8; poly [ADP-ribose] polymerase 6/8